jgi:molecular chaperone GrpE
MADRQPPGEPAERSRPTDAPPSTEAEGASGAGDAERATAPAPEASGGAETDEEAAGPTDPLAEARRERDEYLELAQRTRADFDNYRKRAVREAEDAERRARAALATRLVPILDNLERALRAAGIDPETVGEDAPDPAVGEAGGGEALAQGVALVYRELRVTLERAGVEAYDPAGERFDPAWHEALETRDADGTEPGMVLATVEKGYRLDGQVLRAARVVVSQ